MLKQIAAALLPLLVREGEQYLLSVCSGIRVYSNYLLSLSCLYSNRLLVLVGS
nr:MAG TPA: hypothetical protein [Caudoviricetes sp.]